MTIIEGRWKNCLLFGKAYPVPSAHRFNIQLDEMICTKNEESYRYDVSRWLVTDNKEFIAGIPNEYKSLVARNSKFYEEQLELLKSIPVHSELELQIMNLTETLLGKFSSVSNNVAIFPLSLPESIQTE